MGWHPYHFIVKFNFQWVIDLNMESKTSEILEDEMGERPICHERQCENFDYIKTKNFSLSKYPMNK